MALSQTARALIPALALLAAFAVVLVDLQRESLWDDDGFTLWVPRAVEPPPASLRAAPRYLIDSLGGALARARADVHPPLYFLALDIWSLLAGASIFSVRLFSALAGVIGLAAVYALGARLFDRRAALWSLLLLATAGAFIYYGREARMYSALLALATLATLAYLRWRDRPGAGRVLLYGGLLAALVYTHYAGALIALTHTLHLLLTRPRRLPALIAPVAVAALLFAPWLPALLSQWAAHGGPAALPVASDWQTVAGLMLVISGGHGALYLTALIPALLAARRRADPALLLALWLLLTPAALLALNAWVTPLFQIRYALAALPALALALAWGLRELSRLLPDGRLQTGAPALLLAALLYAQLSSYPGLWPSKPDWEETIARVLATRNPLEPALTDFTPTSPAAYYDRRDALGRGIALDLAWRWHDPDEMRALVDHLVGAESLWLMMPGHSPRTWDAAAALLDAGYAPAHRDSVMTQLFYRFDRGGAGALDLRFGEALAFNGAITRALVAQPGAPLCFDLDIRPLTDDADYRLHITLTQGYNTVRATTTAAPTDWGLFEVCLPVPADAPAGPHHLRLRAYRETPAAPLPVIESESHFWGYDLIAAGVSVVD